MIIIKSHVYWKKELYKRKMGMNDQWWNILEHLLKKDNLEDKRLFFKAFFRHARALWKDFYL
jgi:hypothetical protein